MGVVGYLTIYEVVKRILEKYENILILGNI